MKIAYIVIAILAFTACKEKPSEKEVVTVPSEENEVPEISDASETKNPFLGAWIHPYYTTVLSKVKSAYDMRTFSSPITELVVSNTAVVLVHNNSEGESVGYSIWKDEGETIGILDNRAKLIMLREDRLRLVQGKAEIPFVRSPEPSTGVSVFETLVRSKLIVGTYSGAANETSFMINGDVTGLSDFVSYRIITRFDDLGDFDMIEFKTISGNTTYMGWKVMKDELILYEVIDGGDYVHAQGKERYRLKLKQAMS